LRAGTAIESLVRAVKGVNFAEESDMDARGLGVFIAIFVAIFVAIFCSMIAALDSEKQRAAAREKRLAEHRMNARLLRFDI
jgi:hypothetical protein